MEKVKDGAEGRIKTTLMAENAGQCQSFPAQIKRFCTFLRHRLKKHGKESNMFF